MKHLIEELKGTGKVYSGDQLLRIANYRLFVWQEDASPAVEPRLRTLPSMARSISRISVRRSCSPDLTR